MGLYEIVLFVHVISAIGYSAGALISLFGLVSLRRSRSVAEVRPIMALQGRTGMISGIGMLFVIASGLYMTGARWGWQTGWVYVTMVALVLLMLMGILMGKPRHKTKQLLKDQTDGLLPESLKQLICNPWVAIGYYTQVTLLVGIVFLMTVKPGLYGSLLTMGVAIILGVLSQASRLYKIVSQR